MGNLFNKCRKGDHRRLDEEKGDGKPKKNDLAVLKQLFTEYIWQGMTAIYIHNQ